MKETFKLIRQIFLSIASLMIVAIIIRFYIVQPFSISGSSMEPSFFDKEYLIVNELTYQFSAPKRGDVVIFRHPTPACNEHIEASYLNRIFFQGNCSNYIKRVIATPGETITIRDGKISVKTKDDEVLNLKEEYILSNIPTLGNQNVTLAKDEYFVLGDNRNPNASSDSREWGVLPRSHILGKALVVLLPPDELGFVPKPSY
jgi:signal peptidase I